MTNLVKQKIKSKKTRREEAAIHNAKIPLLQCPLEIREHIYKYVLGHETVLLIWRGPEHDPNYMPKRWYSRRPDAKRFGKAFKYKILGCPCYDLSYRPEVSEHSWHYSPRVCGEHIHRLELGMLRSCRQINSEYTRILYADRTFRFRSSEHKRFPSFYQAVTSPLFKTHLTHLEVQHFIHQSFPTAETGYLAFCNTLATLPNLHRLRILFCALEYRPEELRCPGAEGKGPLSEEEEREGWLKPLRAIRVQKLEISVPRCLGVIFREAGSWPGTVVRPVTDWDATVAACGQAPSGFEPTDHW